MAGFNLAETGDTSRQLTNQAVRLTNRIKSSAAIDAERDWKVREERGEREREREEIIRSQSFQLITIVVGHNDICQLSCKNNSSPSEFVSNVRNALDYLHENLSSALINLVQPSDPGFYLSAFNRPVGCRLASRILCPCLESHDAPGESRASSQMATLYRDGLKQLVGRSSTQNAFGYRLSALLLRLIQADMTSRVTLVS